MEGLSHEKLDVYQESLEFVRYVDLLINDLSSGDPAVKQLDRASDSISLNIAEGNGKFREKDRCSYFDTAKGSAFECASCLDLLVAKQLVEEEEVKKGKEMLQEIISMLIGLIRNNSDRAYEGQEEYVTQD